MRKTHYVPMLRCKRAELNALKDLSVDIKDQIIPYLKILKWSSDEIKKKVAAICTYWPIDKPVYIDAELFFEDFKGLRKAGNLEILFNEFKKTGLMFIPVVSLTLASTYIDITKKFSKNGICIRVKNEDIEQNGFEAIFDQLIENLNLHLGNIDLIIDFPSVINGQINTAVSLAELYINQRISNIQKFKRIIISGSSFPVDLSNYEPGEHLIPRKEFQLFKLLNTRKLKVKPIFGDYAIFSDEIKELDPTKITVSASIRYTIEEFWLVFRGRSITKYGSEQFYSFSQELIKNSAYDGPKFSLADLHIKKCAEGQTTNGSAESWLKIGACHHITKTVCQLSKFSDS